MNQHPYKTRPISIFCQREKVRRPTRWRLCSPPGSRASFPKPRNLFCPSSHHGRPWRVSLPKAGEPGGDGCCQARHRLPGLVRCAPDPLEQVGCSARKSCFPFLRSFTCPTVRLFPLSPSLPVARHGCGPCVPCRCRYEKAYMPFYCGHERHEYEKCQYME